MSRRIKTNYSEPKKLQLRKDVFNISELSGNFDDRNILTASFEQQQSGTFDQRYILTGSTGGQKIDSPLVLSASNLKVNETISSYNSHLILSSSVGSEVYVSGALHISGSHTFTGSLLISEGKLGIGTNNPSARLTVADSSNPTLRIAEGDSSTDYAELSDESDGDFRIRKRRDSGNVLMHIDPLPVDNTSAGTVRFFRLTDTTGAKRVIFYKGDNTTTAHAQIGVDGTTTFFQSPVGIGQTTGISTITLYVTNGNEMPFRLYRESTGTSHLAQFYSNDGGTNTQAARIECDGDYITVSDAAVKRNIDDIASNPITQLRPVEYKKLNSDRTKAGFIAQELELVLPHLVSTDDKGIKGISYAGIIPYLVKCCQEQQTEIETLKVEIQSI